MQNPKLHVEPFLGLEVKLLHVLEVPECHGHAEDECKLVSNVEHEPGEFPTTPAHMWSLKRKVQQSNPQSNVGGILPLRYSPTMPGRDKTNKVKMVSHMKLAWEWLSGMNMIACKHTYFFHAIISLWGYWDDIALIDSIIFLAQ